MSRREYGTAQISFSKPTSDHGEDLGEDYGQRDDGARQNRVRGVLILNSSIGKRMMRLAITDHDVWLRR